MLLYLRHDPEKEVHWLPGCLIVFANDKAVLSRRQKNRTPSGLSVARLGKALGR